MELPLSAISRQRGRFEFPVIAFVMCDPQTPSFEGCRSFLTQSLATGYHRSAIKRKACGKSVEGSQEVSAPVGDFIAVAEDVSARVGDLIAVAEDVSARVGDLIATVEDISARVGDFVATVEEVSAPLEDINAVVKDVSPRVGDLMAPVEDVIAVVRYLGEWAKILVVLQVFM